jgi:hypothetical protein
MRFSACAELADRASAIGIIANSAAINLPSRRMVSPSVSDARLVWADRTATALNRV